MKAKIMFIAIISFLFLLLTSCGSNEVVIEVKPFNVYTLNSSFFQTDITEEALRQAFQTDYYEIDKFVWAYTEEEVNFNRIQEHINGFAPDSKDSRNIYIIRVMYKPIDYTITYIDSISKKEIGTQTYNIEEFDGFVAPEKEGYVVEHFEDEENNVITTIDYQKPKDRTITVYWEYQTFHINYDAEGTNPNQIDSFTNVTETYQLLNMPDQRLYTFDGWYLDDKKVTELDFSLYFEDITLVAKYAPIDFEIKLYADNEYVTSVYVNALNYQNLDLPDVPEKEGYDGSWDIESIGLDDIGVLENGYAKYTVKSYDIIYNLSYPDVLNFFDSLNLQTKYQYGQTLELPEINVDHYGYYIYGYKINGGSYSASSIVVQSDLIVDILMGKTVFKATYYDEAGNVYTVQTFDIDTILTYNHPGVPSKYGYSGSWNHETIDELHDFDIYPVYTPEVFKISYVGPEYADPDDNMLVKSIAFGEKKWLYYPNYIDGRNFLGFYLNGTQVKYLENVVEDVTLEMRYETIVYRIDFKVDGLFDPVPSIECTVDDVVTLPTIESNSRYIFKGWADSSGEEVSVISNTLGWWYLYPIYEGVTYHINICNELEELIQVDEVRYGETYYFPDVKPSNDNYSNVGFIIRGQNYFYRFVYEFDYDVIAVMRVKPNTFENIRVFNNIFDNIRIVEATYPDTYRKFMFEMDGYDLKGIYADSSYEKEINPDDYVTNTNDLFLYYVANKAVRTYQEFNELYFEKEGAYYLDCDIDFEGNEITTFSDFSGILNGYGHKLYNFKLSDKKAIFETNNGKIYNLVISEFEVNATIDSGSTNSLLVGTNNGRIENVVIENGTVNYIVNDDKNQEYRLGLLTGVNGGEIVDSSLTGVSFNIKMSKSATSFSIASAMIGEICAINNGTVLQSSAQNNLWFDTQSTRIYCGSVAGINNGVISKTSAKSTIKAKAYYGDWFNFGGFVGQNKSKGEILQSGSLSHLILDTDATTQKIGGFVGENNNTVDSCYSNSVIEGQAKGCGGFVGNNFGPISYSYATGLISLNGYKEPVGGFVGIARTKIEKCFSTTSIDVSESSRNVTIVQFGICYNTIVDCYALIGTEYYGDKYQSSEENKEYELVDYSSLINQVVPAIFGDNSDWLVVENGLPILNYLVSYNQVTHYEPTCTTRGFDLYYSDEFGISYVDNFEQPIGHSYEYVETVKPTCSSQGYDLYRCSHDDCLEPEIHENITDMLDHDLENAKIVEEVKPTCLNDGYVIYECRACHALIKVTLEKTGHSDYDDTALIVESTCENNGFITYACTHENCDNENHVVVIIIAKKNHDYQLIQEEVKAYCDQDGEHLGSAAIYECQVCHYQTPERVLYPEHHYVEKEVLLEPTCTTFGKVLYECDICGKQIEKETPKKSHVDENNDYYCDLCGYVVIGSENLFDGTWKAITSVEDLLDIRNDMAGKYYLAANINVGYNFTALGYSIDRYGRETIVPFTGKLYGYKDYKITFDYYDLDNLNFTKYGGLFYLNQGTICNLNIECSCLRKSGFVNTTNTDFIFGGVSIINEGFIVGVKVYGSGPLMININSKYGGLVDEISYHENRTEIGFIATKNAKADGKTGVILDCVVDGTIQINQTNICYLTYRFNKTNVVQLLSGTSGILQTIMIGGIASQNDGIIQGSINKSKMVVTNHLRGNITNRLGNFYLVSNQTISSICASNNGELSKNQYLPTSFKLENSDVTYNEKTIHNYPGYSSYRFFNNFAGENQYALNGSNAVLNDNKLYVE